MVEETKYCKYIKRKNFKKELVMTKGNNKKLKQLINIIYVIHCTLQKMFEGDHCHVAYKYRGTPHKSH